MHSFQNFIVRLIPNHPPPLETRIWKLVVRALIIRTAGFKNFGIEHLSANFVREDFWHRFTCREKSR